MKILVVDDQYDKIPKISEICDSIALGMEIVHHTTGGSARRALLRSAFDLLIVDLNLASDVGAHATDRGGLDFLRLISVDPGAKISSNVVVLTSREDLHAEFTDEAIDLGAQICHFSTHKTAWIGILSGQIRFINHVLKRRIKMIESADVVMITALRSPELEAVLKLPYNFKPLRLAGDPSSYHIGETDVDGSKTSILAVAASRKGMSSAATLAAKAVAKFKPRLLIMTGICAGVIDKVSLGDVIVCDPGWDWGSGKYAIQENGAPVFKQSPHQYGLDISLREIARDLADSADVKSSIRAGWLDKVPAGRFSIHVGPLASGGAVIADEHVTRAIVEQNRDLIGVDMEAYAVMAAAENASVPKPYPIVIKSVCDYANSEKNDDWQTYASYTSAAFTKFFIDEAIRWLSRND